VQPGNFPAWRQIAGVDEKENLWRLHDEVVCLLDSIKPMDTRRGWSHVSVQAPEVGSFRSLRRTRSTVPRSRDRKAGVDAERRIADLEAQIAAKDARIAEQDARIAELEKKLAALIEERTRNSSNSNLPPSSDSPATRAEKNARKQAAKKDKRKRGGQPGHRGARRELLPPERVDDVVDLFPEHCAAVLPGSPSPRPIRFQLTELPAFEPHTTEYRWHCVTCPRCRRETTAPHDTARIPTSPFGPRLMTVVGLLTGVYHLSRRSGPSSTSPTSSRPTTTPSASYVPSCSGERPATGRRASAATASPSVS